MPHLPLRVRHVDDKTGIRENPAILQFIFSTSRSSQREFGRLRPHTLERFTMHRFRKGQNGQALEPIFILSQESA